MAYPLSRRRSKREDVKTKQNPLNLDPEEYVLRKRLPPKLPRRNNDVYITNKTNFKAQQVRCQKLLDSGEAQLYIHGLGAAVCRAINLALQLKRQNVGTVEVATNTSTVELIDDFEPQQDSLEPETQTRNNSAVHIKEIVKWLGLTVFEIWIALLSLTIFSVLVVLKCEHVINNLSWWIVFTPLFIGDGLNAYFCVIVFIRQYVDGVYKTAMLRAIWSLAVLVLLFVFKFLLCKKLVGQSALEYSEVMSPIFVLLHLVVIRACQLH